MFLISHRGNVNGINKKDENKPEYIETAIQYGFDVEVDVRYKQGNFFLGHDEDQFKVSKNFLLNEKIWCHAKTSEALVELKNINAHFFWHQEDDYTITSKGFIWTYPNKKLLPQSICVLPEKGNYKEMKCSGICSDFIKKYKND